MPPQPHRVESLPPVLMPRSLGRSEKITWNLYACQGHIDAMNEITADNILPADSPATHRHGPKEPLPALMLGAIGIVFGDIGTSPLYAMKEVFVGPHPLALDRMHI